MSDEITTRRALEVCMSRLPMPGNVRDFMAYKLAQQIDNDTPLPSGDIDAMRAMLITLKENTTVYDNFPKRALLSRLSVIREQIDIALRGPDE